MPLPYYERWSLCSAYQTARHEAVSRGVEALVFQREPDDEAAPYVVIEAAHRDAVPTGYAYWCSVIARGSETPARSRRYHEAVQLTRKLMREGVRS